MKVLILGYSAFSQKTVIPEILAHPDFELAGVASKSRLDKIVIANPAEGGINSVKQSRTGLPRRSLSSLLAMTSDNYSEAIRKSGCEVVYISLCNNLHNEWILESLKAGKHVMVDKPGVLNGKEARECLRAAGEKLLIYESLPFLHHEEHKILKKEKGVIFIDVAFGFPKLPADNFRNFKKFGGGAVNDLGPYLIATGEYYFGIYPETIYSAGSFERRVIVLDYGKGRIINGTIGFGMEYQNKMELWGEGFYYRLERAFTTPIDFKNKIYFRKQNREGEIDVRADNAFRNMLSDFNKIFKSGNYEKTNESFFKRARVLGEMNND